MQIPTKKAEEPKIRNILTGLPDGEKAKYFRSVKFMRWWTDVRKRFKEYDGCYFGHYAQWFFWFFFVLGFFVSCAVIVMLVGRQNYWF